MYLEELDTRLLCVSGYTTPFAFSTSLRKNVKNMAPTFVSTLFSSRAGSSDTAFPQTPGSNSSSGSKNASASSRNTLTSFRKFRTSFSHPTTSLSSSTSSTPTPASIDEEEDLPRSSAAKDKTQVNDSKTSDALFASVPASYRYSLRPSTPLWSAVGARLSKKGSKTVMASPEMHSSTITTRPDESCPALSSLAQSIQLVQDEEDDTGSLFGTVTRNTLKRTLSRLSLNAPTIMNNNGRKHRERNATSGSGSSLRSRGSPRFGTSSVSRSNSIRRESPRIASTTNSPQFRLPRLQSFSPNLRFSLSDDEEDDVPNGIDSDKRKALKVDKASVDTGGLGFAHFGRSSVSSASSSKAPAYPPSPSITSSPMSRFGFSSSTSSSGTSSTSATTSTTATDDTRYAELANLISIIEHSPTLCRSPLSNSHPGTIPSTPNLERKKSSFSLSKSLSRSRLRIVEISPILLQPAPPKRSKDREATNLVRKAGPPAALGISHCGTEKTSAYLGIPQHKTLEARSYSFPYPSARPEASELDLLRLKSSKSLGDLYQAALCSSLTPASVPQFSRTHSSKTEYYDMLPENDDDDATNQHTLKRKLSSTSGMSYPALCTPPRTPQSRHASIEWYADIADDAIYEHEQEAVVACDESALMPAFLLRPISMATSCSSGDSERTRGDDIRAQANEGEVKPQRKDVYDSLMDIIDSFPSPTFIPSSGFSSSSCTPVHSPSSPVSNATSTSGDSQDSPIDSIWSLRRQTVFGPAYSPLGSVATPASEVNYTPATSYFGTARDKEDGKESEEQELREEDVFKVGHEKIVSENVLASHRALTDILKCST
ncbi:hypothetical protein P389DRAFT_188449 [Cystobasidium minutum MCA 4210]|uniref:uncharacterized protein n=1 Tax=Cystobasidium minutum MCA 4210 TaxID=1397322 RepID=UPI0034CF89DA|eukprot:jgi/Rhomi1/188449/estExt_fgenesh1_pg.C_2_t20300